MRGAEAAVTSGRPIAAAAASSSSSSAFLPSPRCCSSSSRSSPFQRRSCLRDPSSAAAERLAGLLGSRTAPRASQAAPTASQIRCRRRRNRAAAVVAAVAASDEDSLAASTSTSTSRTASSPSRAAFSFPARSCSSRLVAASIAAVVCANRLLEPVDAAYCGSVVNRHTSNASEPSLDRECDELVEPHRNQAIAAGAVGLGFLGLAALADRSRQPEPI